jgi:hypothetical protein
MSRYSPEGIVTLMPNKNGQFLIKKLVNNFYFFKKMLYIIDLNKKLLPIC